MGSGARFLAGFYIDRNVSRSIPLGAGETGLPLPTLFVNVLGCFLICSIMEWGAATGRLSEPLRLLLVTGVLGGFTTYSTYHFELFEWLRAGRYGAAALYAFLTLAGGITAGVAGIWLGKQVFT